jgi:hypothetical protein
MITFVHWVQWFQEFFDGKAHAITDDIIEWYEPLYRKARHDLKAARAVRARLQRSLKQHQRSVRRRMVDKAREPHSNFFAVNTNMRHDAEAHRHMLDEHEACAFEEPWKYDIEDISKGDIVFLYESFGPGIVAFGRAARSEPDRRDSENAYCMPLEEFRRVVPPISAVEIKSLDNSGRVFRQTVNMIESDLGQRLYEMALNR